jgi:HAD superfamily hydrolase (TIGR01549 family)
MSASPVKKGLHPLLRGARAVLFDMGGTLVHPDWERLARLAEKDAGRVLSLAEMSHALGQVLKAADMGLNQDVQHLTRDRKPNWLFRDMYRLLGISEFRCEQLRARACDAHLERHLWSQLNPHVRRVLSDLRNQDVQVGVISNTDDGRLRELLELLEIASQFDVIVDSYIVRHRKPDAEIFNFAVAQLGLGSREVVYIGDSYNHDVLGAEAAGLRSILLDSFDIYRDLRCLRIRTLGELTAYQEPDQ